MQVVEWNDRRVGALVGRGEDFESWWAVGCGGGGGRMESVVVDGEGRACGAQGGVCLVAAALVAVRTASSARSTPTRSAAAQTLHQQHRKQQLTTHPLTTAQGRIVANSVWQGAALRRPLQHAASNSSTAAGQEKFIPIGQTDEDGQEIIFVRAAHTNKKTKEKNK
eukprot:m.431030 g.431030  ORF g.431030 m.431030 type:complete len:166 (+) comp56734_c0_seq5:1494-1991(+)